MNPAFAEGPCRLEELFRGGEVYVFKPDMRLSQFRGSFAPTFRNVAFPPVPTEGSFAINAASVGLYRGTYAFAAAFIRRDTGDFVRTDGWPAAGSNAVTPFRYHVKILTTTIHVGDGYDPYMANWEVPYPEGIEVRRTFVVDPAPAGLVVLRGGYWGTYYSDNPFFINGRFISYIPGQYNGNNWSWSSGVLPPSDFRRGENLITFKCTLYGTTGHWDNYMAKGWEIYYN
jgi:hypothetical protein